MSKGVNRQVLLVEKPAGKLGPEHFKMSETAMPEPADGEALVRVRYISLDAANRAWMHGATYRAAVEPNTVMAGGGIAEVIASKASGLAPGDIVLVNRGFVPPGDRIATFDNDGTLWAEQPMPPQFDFIFQSWMQEAKADPSLASKQPHTDRKLGLQEEVQRYETELIRDALQRTRGNQRRAAQLLGVKVTTLNCKIKRLGIGHDLQSFQD